MNKKIFIKLVVLFSLAAIGTAGLIWIGRCWYGVKMHGIYEWKMRQFFWAVLLGVVGMYGLTASLMQDMAEEEAETIHETYEEIREEITAMTNADERYKEIGRLEVMLKNANIPFEKERYFNGWLLKYPAFEECRFSVAEHVGSYGAGADCLEMWDMKKEDPEGWLRAEDVLLEITKDWVEHGKL